ncbi:MAG: hypothetical protein HC840_07545 [Leptolyngbyaceae cyanobacterium RM2_2_4]|nr:hypothetical protein [Leptolyngbyaceae cyanobacterium RM2_2_4]
MVRAIAAVGIDGRLLLILSLRQELFDRQPDTTAMPVVQHHKLTVDCLGARSRLILIKLRNIYQKLL